MIILTFNIKKIYFAVNLSIISRHNRFRYFIFLCI